MRRVASGPRSNRLSSWQRARAGCGVSQVWFFVTSLFVLLYSKLGPSACGGPHGGEEDHPIWGGGVEARGCEGASAGSETTTPRHRGWEGVPLSQPLTPARTPLDYSTRPLTHSYSMSNSQASTSAPPPAPSLAHRVLAQAALIADSSADVSRQTRCLPPPSPPSTCSPWAYHDPIPTRSSACSTTPSHSFSSSARPCACRLRALGWRAGHWKQCAPTRARRRWLWR